MQTSPRAAYDRLFCALMPRLRRRTIPLAGSAESAQDALHDAYLKLAKHPHRLVRHPEPYAYAYTAVVSAIRDGRRRLRREVLRAELSSRPWDGGLAVREAELDASRLLARLTPRQAEIVRLVDLEGYTLDAAAALLGRHRGTLSRSRDRALKKLRGLTVR